MLLLEPAPGESVLDRAVEVAHRHLGLDAVYIAEVSESGLTVKAAAGRVADLGVAPGVVRRPDESLTQRLILGQIPNLISDVAANPALARIAGAHGPRIAAYLGVPLRYPDGELFGAICAVSLTPDPSLDARDVRFLELLGELLATPLGRQRATDATSATIQSVLDDRQVAIAAQPIVSLRDGVCLGVEALSRFPAGVGAPAAVFAQAASCGLDVALERLAVQQAWPLLDLLQPQQFLTVNLSPAAIFGLAESAHNRAGLPLSQLVVELTEHSEIAGYQRLREVLQPLRDAGLRVAVDDAGAGYASLRHVVELRPDFIKVDRALVHGLAEDHARRVAVSAFVLLALDLDATVIAEGLERPADLSALIDLGVDAAQGFLLGRPTRGRANIRRTLRGDRNAAGGHAPPQWTPPAATPAAPRTCEGSRPTGNR